MSKQKKPSAEAAVRDIRRRTRWKFSPEEKIRIVLEGLRGEQSISELCAAEKGSRPTSTTAGARTSSRPVRSGLRETRSERRRVTR
jgi:transposase-like protein